MFTPKQGAIGGRSRTSRLRVTANYSWPCLLGPRETPSLQQYMRNVTERPSRPGARVLPYLDDFLIMFTSEEQASFCACWVRESIEFLGLSCHPTKCQWEPSQSVYHLGITVNTAAGVFRSGSAGAVVVWVLSHGTRSTPPPAGEAEMVNARGKLHVRTFKNKYATGTHLTNAKYGRLNLMI
ncbi:hypothetical protein VOLCADRAFT_105017 [Volvox carteri f. nagariensis]|uniref:Reverse transcriptase domain-containing protein n=1 Tax=Volvox carteri f. nagariensis TaxID=3068 RepID=D8TXU2_VOLCA|nr:uncharacterized protein VOLCADRAFT_105017 [Volvox carteri f. nagariensis]EFJ47702.1 hypothetical protein VOLCADRAFT_105017 [Volvox carteri f. nagariensis]|eukprot:XP_002951173.1 hypothetical protein VOLCADRAFT_105017 [Volvox carteri f. nagariensis]